MAQTSHLSREIYEQPQVLRTFLEQEQPAVQTLADAIRSREIHYVFIAARGTSDNAARYANYLLGSVNRLPVALAAPSLFSIYRQPPRLQNALVLGISQSGKSPDIVSVLAEAQRQGVLTAAITNFADSDLARQADHVIQLRAGLEQSLAATKTYTSELAAIALLSSLLAQDKSMEDALAQIPAAVEAVLAINEHVAQVAQRYRYMRYCVVIGRGYNYASAFELALKLKELTYTVAEPYSSADFLHGPMALIEEGFPVIVFAPSGVLLAEMQQFLRTLRQREAEPIVISDDDDTLALARIALPLSAAVPEWLSPITAIVPGQLFALHLALARGYDPDQPRGLHKVTETW
ncbi:MAG: glucosamine--fructose-6-phosphate aminotransferase [Chloroflexi bacterium]|nr:MAG: glucosamine--fructose-6-phosphate aminotransferase [Chloroflexota bacterium]